MPPSRSTSRSAASPASIDKLVVYPENMRKNLDRLGGLVHSQRVLIALTQKGVAREDAYRLVQRNAMKVWRGEGDFLALLKADKDVRKHLSEAELEANFDLDYHFKHVDTIFARVRPGLSRAASTRVDALSTMLHQPQRRVHSCRGRMSVCPTQPRRPNVAQLSAANPFGERIMGRLVRKPQARRPRSADRRARRRAAVRHRPACRRPLPCPATIISSAS